MLKRDDAFKSVVKFETSITDNGKIKLNINNKLLIDTLIMNFGGE